MGSDRYRSISVRSGLTPYCRSARVGEGLKGRPETGMSAWTLGRAWLSEPAVELDVVRNSTGERTARRAVPTQGSPKPIIRSPVSL